MESVLHLFGVIKGRPVDLADQTPRAAHVSRTATESELERIPVPVVTKCKASPNSTFSAMLMPGRVSLMVIIANPPIDA